MALGKLALVLSGGGMGGAAHLGAIKALEEYSLTPDAVLGTSIGAFVGSVYASGATPQMMIEGWQAISRMDPADVLDLDLNALRAAFSRFDYRRVTGFLMGRVLMGMLAQNYVHLRSFAELARLSPAERRAKNIKEFYACATNLLDGRETVFCDTRGIPLDADGLFEGRRLCHHVSFVDAVRASFSLPAVFTPHKIPFAPPADPCT
ncbi:MAG: patatin-like phospholipase family protein, partial [Anaerolineae bacterium]